MKVTIEDIVDFYKQYPEHVGKIDVLTRFGFYPILAADITAKDSLVYVITTTGNEVECSPDHLLLRKNPIGGGDESERTWTSAKDLKLGDWLYTRCGRQQIISMRMKPEVEDLYDLQVDKVKEFYADGIVSHNSTILDALSYGLYGKPFRKINKAQLINSINNKPAEVEVEFRVNDCDYKIYRNIKKYGQSKFEVYKNDDMFDQVASAREQQEMVEKHILRLNHKSFSQIVILGSSSFIPFMELSAHHRREVIEDLLDIEIFSVMNTLLKDKVQNNKMAIDDIKYNIEIIEKKVSLHKDYIRKQQHDSQQQINEKNKKIKEHEQKKEEMVKKHMDGYERIHVLATDDSNVKPLEEKKRTLETFRIKLQSKKDRLNKDISFYDKNNDCPTCKQVIDGEFKNSIIEKNKTDVNEIEEAYTKLNKIHQQTCDELDSHKKILQQIKEIEQEQDNCRAEIRMLDTIINTIREDIKKIKEPEKVEETEKELQELQQQQIAIQQQQQGLSEDREVLSVVSMMLKDSGIKTRIIKQYIPIMNKLIQKYLAEMEFFVQFDLDENFNETIRSRYRDDFSYASFSEGEKMRINLALLFTWRAIAKLRNSVSCNLLILDEIFDSSLDGSGTEEFLKILNELAADTNTFVISHKTDQMVDRFQNVIHFEKKNNFSRVVDTRKNDE